MALSAEFVTAETAAYVTFDADIAVGPLANWAADTFEVFQASARYETMGVTRPGAANVVRVAMVNAGPTSGAGTIDYDDALGTLVGVNGQPVAGFAGLACPPV